MKIFVLISLVLISICGFRQKGKEEQYGQPAYSSFDSLRNKWKEVLVGSSIDLSDSDYLN